MNWEYLENIPKFETILNYLLRTFIRWVLICTSTKEWSQGRQKVNQTEIHFCTTDCKLIESDYFPHPLFEKIPSRGTIPHLLRMSMGPTGYACSSMGILLKESGTGIEKPVSLEAVISPGKYIIVELSQSQTSVILELGLVFCGTPVLSCTQSNYCSDKFRRFYKAFPRK